MSHDRLPRPVPLTMRLSVWWHRKRNPGHHSLLRRVSVPSWDSTARGYLIRCTNCERTWAA